MFDLWKVSKHSYRMPRIRNEFHLGRHEGCSRATVAPLMGIYGAVGIDAAGIRRLFQSGRHAHQRLARPVREPRGIGCEVDIASVQHKELLEQFVVTVIEPVDVAAPGPPGVRDHERVTTT